jgi:hypothetical protein
MKIQRAAESSRVSADFANRWKQGGKIRQQLFLTFLDQGTDIDKTECMLDMERKSSQKNKNMYGWRDREALEKMHSAALVADMIVRKEAAGLWRLRPNLGNNARMCMHAA